MSLVQQTLQQWTEISNNCNITTNSLCTVAKKAFQKYLYSEMGYTLPSLFLINDQ